MPRMWLYKCNVTANLEGDWGYFFDKMGGYGEWGGTGVTENPSSARIMREAPWGT